jgi:hypothetical protein
MNEQVLMPDTKDAPVCEHDYSIVAQGSVIFGQTSTSSGDARFAQKLCCTKCPHETKSSSNNPLCLDCKVELAWQSDAQMQPRAEEYRAAQNSTADSCGGLGKPLGYCCPKCDRLYAYRQEGD